jgi:hypothetical protein
VSSHPHRSRRIDVGEDDERPAPIPVGRENGVGHRIDSGNAYAISR